ncbi:putative aminoglycoside phosphotransferase [Desulfocapsa sulfexigens DSM 10523]|uniref:Putative aminoglycoside phosphotransferase n=1 Tax=Desulfocapsa sulfexigens (strain DSM 10523 / SB164P1) TaxID=1167006 RepID=M1PBI6_DESSD|nr:phosphotransferase [Desulfocapsa sulfexigens]AGF78977.1 putative aminoglycoside phosphotransferase [Desulfocapsa sulfexigens DSM 10523]
MELVPLFRGAQIGSILKSLEKIEEDSGLFTNSEKMKKVFLDSANEAIICGYGKRLIQWRRGIKTAIRRHSPQLFYTPIGDTYSNASRIRVKNNVIAFYPEWGLVCKFWLGTGVRKINNLSNEAKAIMTAERYNFLKVPKIVLDKSSFHGGQPPALWFELFRGYFPPKATDNKSKTALEFLRVMFLWYQEHGIHFIKPGEVSQIDKRVNVNFEELLSYGWEPEKANLILLANKRIVESRKTLPVSYIHGDASVGNCLVNEAGEVLILDWEETRKGYIAEDVFTLFQHGGVSVRESYEKWLANIAPNDAHTLACDIQLEVLRMWKNLNLQSIRKYLDNIIPTDETNKRIGLIKSRVISSARQICNNI